MNDDKEINNLEHLTDEELKELTPQELERYLIYLESISSGLDFYIEQKKEKNENEN